MGLIDVVDTLSGRPKAARTPYPPGSPLVNGNPVANGSPEVGR